MFFTGLIKKNEAKSKAEASEQGEEIASKNNLDKLVNYITVLV